MEIWEIRDLKRRTIKSCASFHSKVGAIEAYTVYASIAPTAGQAVKFLNLSAVIS